MESNPGTFNQVQKLLELFNPLSDEREKLQKLFGSGFVSDLVRSFAMGDGGKISRNELRKTLNLPFYQTVEVAKEILGADRVLCRMPYSPENLKGLNYSPIPYFRETLVWAKEQNEKEGRNIFLIEIAASQGLTFSEIKDDLLKEGDRSFDFLNNSKVCQNQKLLDIFEDGNKVWKGYYLVDFGEERIVLFSEERKRREHMSIPSTCLFLYYLGKFLKTKGRYWTFRSYDNYNKLHYICVRLVSSKLEVKICPVENNAASVFVGDFISGEDIHLIKRDEY